MEEIMDGIELLRRIRESKLKENTRLVDDYGNEYIYKRDEMGDLTLYEEENEKISIPDYSMFIDNKFEILLKKEEEIEIDSIEELNDTCYLAGIMTCNEKEHYHNSTRAKLNELIKAVKQLNRKVENGEFKS